MDKSRINFKVFKWAVECGNNVKKFFWLKQEFGRCNIANLFFEKSNDFVVKDYVKQKIKQNMALLCWKFPIFWMKQILPSKSL